MDVLLIIPCRIRNYIPSSTRVRPRTPILRVPSINFCTILRLFRDLNLSPRSLRLNPSNSTKFRRVPGRVIVSRTKVFLYIRRRIQAQPRSTRITLRSVSRLQRLVGINLTRRISRTRFTQIIFHNLRGINVFICIRTTRFRTVRFFTIRSIPFLFRRGKAQALTFSGRSRSGMSR